MAAFSATFGSGGGAITAVVSMDGGGIGAMAMDIISARGPYADIPSVVMRPRSDPRYLSLRIRLDAASKDLIIAALAAINALCKAGTTLTIQPTNATNSVVFNVLPTEHALPPFSGQDALIWETRNSALVTLVLRCEPYAYAAAATTLYNAESCACPTHKDLSMVGEWPAPLTITATGASADCHSIYMGVTSDTSWSGYLVEAESLTWSGGSTGAGTTTYASPTGGSAASKKNNSATAATAPITTTAFPPGTYLVLARASVEGNEAGYLSQQYGSTVTVPASSSTWAWYELGEVYLPNVKVRSTGASTLTVSMYATSATASKGIQVDCYAFVPTDIGFLAYHPSSASTDITTLYSDSTGIYADNVVSLASVTGHQIKTLGGRLIMVAERVTPNAATQTVNVTVAYTARYSLWR